MQKSEYRYHLRF